MGNISSLGLQNFNSNLLVKNAGKVDSTDSLTTGPKAFTGINSSGTMSNIDSLVKNAGAFSLDNTGFMSSVDLLNQAAEGYIQNSGIMNNLSTNTNSGDTFIENNQTGLIKDLRVKDYDDATNIWNKGTFDNSKFEAFNSGLINLKNDGSMGTARAKASSGGTININNMMGDISKLYGDAKGKYSNINILN